MFFTAITDVVLYGVGAGANVPVVRALAPFSQLVTLIPSLAVSVRRLHDTGRSGWWVLFAITLFVGPITLLVFTVSNSKPGRNQYGPNLKESGAVAAYAA
ncbi:DUF805 domain-containing protein [Streptomyces sp. MUM 2J]|uniref:DUF805 domain-containing protein n=1 Tax=Streptomyces sp. MUM 2J TaxID=2791987 RepID=UPI001F03877C|nr:DUF805 domain-containing protein [Streptomyces sp. MUM 2J]